MVAGEKGCLFKNNGSPPRCSEDDESGVTRGGGIYFPEETITFAVFKILFLSL